MSAWIIVIVGAGIWIVGQRIPQPRNPENFRIGRVFSLLGLGLFAFGVYAGMIGSVALGTTSIRPFSFAHFMAKSEAEALSYARGHLSISSHPAAAWRGASKNELKCTVINQGDKSLQSLTFSFVTNVNNTEQVRIRGPYPANATKSVLVTVPASALRAYFQEPGMTLNQISGASF